MVSDNIGDYDTVTGRVSVIGLNIEAYNTGAAALRFFATPANANTIQPQNNFVLRYDESGSNIVGIIDQ